MTDEELIAKFQERVAAGEIDLRPFGELIFGKFDQDWPARLIALARRGAAVCQIPAGEITDLDLAKIKEAVEKATPGPWWSEGSNIYHDGRYLQCCGRGTIHGCCGDPEVAGHEQESVASAEEKDAEFIALARTAVPALIARLEAAEANLKWEQHRAGRIGTHSEDCHTWGPQHYECLLRKFNEAEARNATAYAEGVEAAAKVAENYLTMDHIAWDGHNSILPKSSTIPD